MGIQINGTNDTITTNDGTISIDGSTTLTGSLTGTTGTFSGDVGVAGTLTSEDKTNIDSVGLITARTGIKIGPITGVAATHYADGSIRTTGIITASSFHGNLTGTATGLNGTPNINVGTITGGNINCTSGRFQRGSATVQDGDAIAGGININGLDMDASVIMSVFGNDGDFTRISGSKSRNASVGSHTIVQDNDVLLSLKGFGSDGTNFEEAAQIEMQVDGTPGNNVMPGRIIFKTATTDGVVERLRIASDGNFEIKSPTNVNGEQVGKFEWWNENSAGIMSKIACVREANTKAPASLAFYTSADVDSSANNSEGDITEHLRITSAGKLQQRSLGTTTNPALSAQHLYDNGITTDGNYYLQTSSMTAPALVRCVFHDNKGWMIIMQHQCVNNQGLYQSHLQNHTGTPNHATNDFQGCSQTDGLNLTPDAMWETFGRNGEDSRMSMYAREIQTSGGSYDETQTYSSYTGGVIWNRTEFHRLFSGAFSDGVFRSSIRVTHNDGASTVYSKKGTTWSSPALACINNGNVDQDLWFCNGADGGDNNWSFGLMQGGTPYPRTANSDNGGGRNSITRWGIIGICEK